MILDPNHPCSPQRRAERQAQIKALRERIISGVVAVADRGRSVSYASAASLRPELDLLERQEAMCDGYRPQRVFYLPLCGKGL